MILFGVNIVAILMFQITRDTMLAFRDKFNKSTIIKVELGMGMFVQLSIFAVQAFIAKMMVKFVRPIRRSKSFVMQIKIEDTLRQLRSEENRANHSQIDNERRSLLLAQQARADLQVLDDQTSYDDCDINDRILTEFIAGNQLLES